MYPESLQSMRSLSVVFVNAIEPSVFIWPVDSSSSASNWVLKVLNEQQF